MYLVEVDNRIFKVDVEKEGEDYKILLDGKPLKVNITQIGSSSHLSLVIEHKIYDITVENENTIVVKDGSYKTKVEDERLQQFKKLGKKSEREQKVVITAPMPGLVVEIEVNEGDKVKAGQGVVIVEAMKMQNELKAPRDGVVKQILVQKWTTVNGGDKLVVIE